LRALNPLITPKYFAKTEVHTALQELVISQLPPHVQATQHSIYPDVTVIQNDPVATMPVIQKSIATVDAPMERVIDRPQRQQLRTVNIYRADNREVVTAIELLSPANKVGDNLGQYQQKRSRIIASAVHLIEIDLLRGGQRPGPEVNTPPIDTDYIILRNSENDHMERVSKIWPVAINEPLPTIPVPLLFPDSDVALDLGALVQEIYVSDYYHLQIDYSKPVPAPKLRPEMASWWAKQRNRD